MSDGEHTIISKIPRERLNQIAGRKLSSLAIPVRLAPDRETLEGDLPFSGALKSPASGQPIPRAHFVVQGHDHLRFADPPLSALEPVLFFDCERPSALEQRVGEALQRRVAELQEHASRLRSLGLEVTADAERLAARAVVKTPTHAFEILGSAGAIRVSRVAPVGGQPFDVPASFPEVRLEEHASSADLEVWLARSIPDMEAASHDAARPSVTPRGAQPGQLDVTPPPRTALTLSQIVRAFGAGGMLAPNAPVEVFQEFRYGGTRYRFVASREVETTFRGRIIGPAGDVWSERFELARFPGTAEVVAAALGAAAPGHQDAHLFAQSGPVPARMMPRAGEVWAMHVVLEGQTDDEVRYVGTDIDGRPYGAARVLKRKEFEAVFARAGSGWQLLVILDQVLGDQVLYRQLDAQRQPMGAPRKIGAAVLVANFVPESSRP